MLSWFKNLFKNPKEIIAMAIDSLDLVVPIIVKEIGEYQEKFNELNLNDKVQIIVDKVQSWLRRRFGI